MTATLVAADGSTRVERAAPAADPPIDCFYVYPTVSPQLTTNANLTIDPAEEAVAVAQASRFSQVCRVYAPIYPQLTLATIHKPGGITLEGALTAYTGLATAFHDYLANFNHGRGIVFIGHSQGASILIGLLRQEVDPNPETRKLLVSAILLGGNVTVPVGATAGGDFQHIPACTSASQIGCVVAYSSFRSQPPANALFGRVASGLNPFVNRASAGSLQVLCVNPAALGGGSGPLEPYIPTRGLVRLGADGAGGGPNSISTPWVAYPGEYTARCESSGGATWLQVDRVTGASDHRPVVNETEGAAWGLHLVDVNLALGNLVTLVGQEAAAYRP